MVAHPPAFPGLVYRTHRFARIVVALAALLLGAATQCSCHGAPKDREDFETMPAERFESWKVRVADGHETAAFVMVAHSPKNVETVNHVLTAYAAIAAHPLPAGAFDKLIEDPATDAILRSAIRELAAVLGDDPRGVTPRVKELLGACAAALIAGRDRALNLPAAPPSES